jgi:RimJ/RimL family protein N-acetyltransferase
MAATRPARTWYRRLISCAAEVFAAGRTSKILCPGSGTFGSGQAPSVAVARRYDGPRRSERSSPGCAPGAADRGSATWLPAGVPAAGHAARWAQRDQIRPILPGDAPALAEAIQSADADTIRRRFLGGHPQVTPELLDYLTTVDYTSRFALVAVEPASQRGVAIARYEPAGQDRTAEVAIAVTPGWRDAGLATELLRMLAQAASERGIHTFTGTYLADNHPVTALINEADEPANRVTSRGIAEFSVPLSPPDRGP